MKIYIIPSGWDKELVIKTVFKSGADKVCLVSSYPKKSHVYSQADQITRKLNVQLVDEISKFTDVDTLEVNYIDFKDIVIQVNDYIKRNSENDFVINISTGSHMIAASLMLVAHMNQIETEYSVAQSHNPKIMELVENGEGYHTGFSEILKIPLLPISFRFTPKEKSLLNELKRKKVLSVGEFIGEAKGNMENRKRSEFHYICKKLEKQGLAKITSKGKKIEAKLTQLGEIFVEA